MSPKIRQRVMRDASLSTGARFLWVLLESFADPSGGNCFPGETTLTDVSGHDRKWIYRHLNELEEAKCLVRGKHKVRGGLANIYTLTAPGLCSQNGNIPTFPKVEHSGERCVPKTGTDYVPKRGTTYVPKSGTLPVPVTSPNDQTVSQTDVLSEEEWLKTLESECAAKGYKTEELYAEYHRVAERKKWTVCRRGFERFIKTQHPKLRKPTKATAAQDPPGWVAYLENMGRDWVAYRLAPAHLKAEFKK